MSVKIRPMTLWRTEVENKPGILARTLEPLAGAHADLAVVMGYRYGDANEKAAIELYPVTGKKTVAAAKGLGLAASATPTLLVTGDNKPGLGHMIAKAIADAGVNVRFLMAQVVGRRYSAVIGFDNEADAKTAAARIKKATAAKKKK
jgi:hypothetical protein